MRFGTLVIAMTLALPATAARAEPVTLSGDALRQAITGKIVFLNISGFELPIRYAANGRMSGRMSASRQASREATARKTAANGGSRVTVSASNGRAGWTARPTATASPLRVRPFAGCGTMAARARHGSAVDALT